MDKAKKLDRVAAAYKRRFDPKGVVRVKRREDGYAYATDEVSGRIARYDISAWRVRFVDLKRNGT